MGYKDLLNYLLMKAREASVPTTHRSFDAITNFEKMGCFAKYFFSSIESEGGPLSYDFFSHCVDTEYVFFLPQL